MYTPTTRLLTILELLQARGRIQGAELAERLEVNGRTVRRYITMLQDMGIPVEAERGRHGAYRLRPGYKLPPLLLTDDEALALTVGLLAARQLGLAAAAPAVEGALAKIERVLPAPLRERVQAVGDTVLLDVRPAETPLTSDAIVTLSTAVQTGTRVRLRYRAAGADADSERDFDPYGLVYRHGRTYAVGYCHLREEMRIFRMDRVRAVELSDERFTHPAEFDPLAHVLDTLASTPREWKVEVLLETSLETARRRVPPAAATLSETPEGIVVRCHTSDLEYFAHVLMSVRCPMIIREPPELREAMGDWARYAATLAERVPE